MPVLLVTLEPCRKVIDVERGRNDVDRWWVWWWVQWCSLSAIQGIIAV